LFKSFFSYIKMIAEGSVSAYFNNFALRAKC